MSRTTTEALFGDINTTIGLINTTTMESTATTMASPTALSALMAATRGTQMAASAAATFMSNILLPTGEAAEMSANNGIYSASSSPIPTPSPTPTPSPMTFSTTTSGNAGNGVIYENLVDYPDDVIHNEFVQIFFCILYTTVFVLGVFGNVLVCYVVLRNRAMQTVTNIFITNLALSDILLCVLAVPFTPLYTFMKRWAFGRTLCHLVSFAQGCSIYISTLTLTSIAIDRYFVIIYPFHPRMKLSTCIAIIISIWVIALLATLPYGMYVKVVSEAVFIVNGTMVVNGTNANASASASGAAGAVGAGVDDAVKYDALHWNNDIEYIDYDASVAMDRPTSSPSAAAQLSLSAAAAVAATEAYMQLIAPTTTTTTTTTTTATATATGSTYYSAGALAAGATITKSYCEENWPSEQYRKVFGSVTTILQFVLPFIIISICYTWVSIKLNARARAKPGSKSSRREEADRDRKKRTNRMLIAMVAVFGLSWLPINVVNIFDDFYVKSHEWRFYNLFFFVAHSIAMSSTCYNPFLYAWLNENFRKEFKHVLPCFNPSNNNNIINIARGYNRSERNTCGPRLRHGSECAGPGGVAGGDDGEGDDENCITQETTCLPRERLLIIPREPTYGNGNSTAAGGPLSPQRFGGGGGGGGGGGNPNVRQVEILLNESGDAIRTKRTRRHNERAARRDEVDDVDEVDSADEQTIEMRFCETPFVSSDNTTAISMLETSTSNTAEFSVHSSGGAAGGGGGKGQCN